MIYGTSDVRHNQTLHQLERISGPTQINHGPDEAHRSNHVVTVDMPLRVGKDIRERWSRIPVTPKEARAKPRLTPPYVRGFRPKACTRGS
jgi:hypothetical protein